MKRVLFISSIGGHLSELLKLVPTMKEFESYLITEKTSITENLYSPDIKKVDYLLYGTKSSLKYVYIAPYNFFRSIYLFFKYKPDYIVTTGAHTAVAMCYIAKLFRRKVIYIETFANIYTKTLTGKLIYPIADLFIVQWESMKRLYPKAVVGGWIF